MEQRKLKIQVLIFIIVLIVVNVFSRRVHWQWDLTQDKRYTISDETKIILRNLTEPVDAYVFLQDENLPSAFKKLQQSTKNLLIQFEHESNGMLRFQFENPIKNQNTKQQNETILNLQSRGISPTNVRIKTKQGYSEQLIFPGALLNSGEIQFPVQLLSGQKGQQDINRSIELLEYQFINAISKLQRGYVPTVAFSQGHGELSPIETQDLRTALQYNFYSIKDTEVNENKPISDSIDLLIIAKANQEFTEAEKFSIDQFVMRGGKLIFAIDQMKMEIDSLKTVWGGKNVAVDLQLNLDDLLFTYGLRINRNLVRDLQSKPIPIVVDEQGQTQLMPWTFYPVVSSGDSSNIVKNIKPVSFEFVSSIDTLSNASFSAQVLLHSSENSGLVANPVYVTLEELRDPPPISSFSLQHLPLAVLMVGEFPSLYKFRGLPVDYTNHQKKSSEYTSVALIADGDVLKNTVLPNGEILPLGFDRATAQQFGNKEFLLNLIDLMMNPNHPLEARNKDYTIQLLNQTKAETERSKWQFLAFFYPILSILLFAMVVYFMRKRKYAH